MPPPLLRKLHRPKPTRASFSKAFWQSLGPAGLSSASVDRWRLSSRRPADAISFADILRCIDGPLSLAPFASLTAYRQCSDCKSVETCEIRPILLAVRDTTALLLEGMTLAEAAGGRKTSFI